MLLWDLDLSFSSLFTHLSVTSLLVTSAEEFAGPKKERDNQLILLLRDY